MARKKKADFNWCSKCQQISEFVDGQCQNCVPEITQEAIEVLEEDGEKTYIINDSEGMDVIEILKDIIKGLEDGKSSSIEFCIGNFGFYFELYPLGTEEDSEES